jgi:hypothetical protein
MCSLETKSSKVNYETLNSAQSNVEVMRYHVTCVPDMLLYAAEITMFDSNIVIYKCVQDLHFYVTGGEDENELILAAVLQGFFDSVSLLLRYFWSNF